eukprot:TRINITY_DN10540_c0_g1_i1.p1 TRINITY_DN10540_c0_g1~~TRINITY_DN10540_c0_g1_i1.p1  ORF type:complete len:289 (+),score=23.64 TRINITY_DN10540_c0_g1_i1:33-899(+)
MPRSSIVLMIRLLSLLLPQLAIAKDCHECLQRCDSAWVPFQGTYHWGFSARYNRWLKYGDPKEYIVVESSRGDWTSKRALWTACKCFNGEHFDACLEQPVYKTVSEMPSEARNHVKDGYVLGTGSLVQAPAPAPANVRPKSCSSCLGRCDSAWVPWRGRTYYWGLDERNTRWIKYADSQKLLVVESYRGDWRAKKSLAAVCRCLNGNDYWLCRQTPVYREERDLPSEAQGHVKAGYSIGDPNTLELLTLTSASKSFDLRRAELVERRTQLLAELQYLDERLGNRAVAS